MKTMLSGRAMTRLVVPAVGMIVGLSTPATAQHKLGADPAAACAAIATAGSIPAKSIGLH